MKQSEDVVMNEVVDEVVDEEERELPNDGIGGAEKPSSLHKIQDKFNEMDKRIHEIYKSLKDLQAYSKSFAKDFNSLSKQLNKLEKHKAKTSARPLSGFAIPTKLSDELYKFLNIQPGTMIARKDVTKMMNNYIVENSCRDDKDKRKIIPNEELKKLFGCEDNTQITYFNLQTYMKKHYVK
tara:strand:+ start:482 stop:1024 length:543 start_codon:yes stop_codon:yes gene_type:complete